jgi:hypothetical protein
VCAFKGMLAVAVYMPAASLRLGNIIFQPHGGDLSVREAPDLDRGHDVSVPIEVAGARRPFVIALLSPS